VTIEWAASSLDQFIAKLKVMAAWAPVIGSPLAVLQSSVRANIAAANKQMAEADARMEGFTTRTKARILSIDQLGAKAPRMGLSAQLSSGAVEMYSEDDVKKDTKAAEFAKGVKDIGVSAGVATAAVHKLSAATQGFYAELDKLNTMASTNSLAESWKTTDAIGQLQLLNSQLDGILARQKAIAAGELMPGKYTSKPGSFELGDPSLRRREYKSEIDSDYQLQLLNTADKARFSQNMANADGFIEKLVLIKNRTIEWLNTNQIAGTAMGDLWKQSKDLMESFGRSFSDTMMDFAFGWDDGTMSASDKFKKMVGDMLKQLAKLIFYYGVLVPLIKAAFGDSFGGGSGTGVAPPTLPSLSVAGKATGGSVTAGHSYLVGERGPEMFVPGRSGAIANNSQLTGGSSTPPININIVVTPTSTTTEKKSGDDERGNASKLARQLGDAVRGVIMEELRPGGLIRESAR
jgi:hypothetical protein